MWTPRQILDKSKVVMVLQEVFEHSVDMQDICVLSLQSGHSYMMLPNVATCNSFDFGHARMV